MNTSTVRQTPGCQHPGWKDHWERQYAAKTLTEVSWYQSHPQHSLSTLVDHLLTAGYRDITVLDIARRSIQQAQDRLGDRSQQVTWVESDITDYAPGQAFDIWHDRAVFHFLTNDHDRKCYLETLHKTLKANGQVIIATFSDSGPSQCSGLDVVRYSPETLSQAMGPRLRLVEILTEEHNTPNGGLQQFVYCRFCRNV